MDRIPNPYEPPRGESNEPLAGEGAFGDVKYYRTSIARLSLRELRWLTASRLEFALAVILRTLRVDLSASFAFASPNFERGRVEGGRAFDARALEGPSPSVRDALCAAAAAAETAGLLPLAVYALRTIGTVESAAIAFVAADGALFAATAHVRAWNPRGANDETMTTVFSPLADGRRLVTVGAAPRLLSPPEFDVEHRPGASLAELLEFHRRRLSAAGSPAEVAPTSERQIAQLRDFELRVIEFHSQRGVYVPATPQELESFARLAAEWADAKPPPPARVRWLEVLFLFTALASLVNLWLHPGDDTAAIVMLVGASVSVIGLALVRIVRSKTGGS